MLILLASSSSGSRGGGELFLKYLGEGLVKRGHQVLFWCAEHPRMDELAAILAPLGKVIRAPYRNFYDYKTRIIATCLNHGTSRRIAAQWRDLKPDIIHVNKQNLEDGLDLLRAADQLTVPSLSTIHITQSARYLGARMSRLRDGMARRQLQRYAGTLVAVQEARRRELAKFLGDGRNIPIVYYGVPSLVLESKNASEIAKAKRYQLGLRDTEILVVAVGRLEEQKRPMLFLELAERLHRQLPNVKFLWVGGGSMASGWDAFVARRKLRNVVQRLDWQNDVKPYLFAADFFLHTAAYEGLPIALTEAMSAGLPCAIPGYMLDEVSFFSKETFLVIEEEDALVRALSDRTERQTRAARSRRLAADYFSIEKMAESYESLYNELRNRLNRS